MLILDTDSLTIVQRQAGEAFENLSRRLLAASGSRLVCVTLISLEEQVRGWLARIAKAKTAADLERTYLRFRQLFDDYRDRTLLDFDAKAIAQFEQLRKRKVRIGTMDLKIAAIALANQATLISGNLRDLQQVPGLHVEDWTRTQ